MFEKALCTLKPLLDLDVGKKCGGTTDDETMGTAD